MNKNVKSIFFVATLLILLVGVSAISASEVSDDTTVILDTADTVAQEVTTTTTDNKIVETPTKNVKKEETTTDLYVSDTTGSDENSGTIDSPYKTLQKALDTTNADSTFNIHIAEGTYKGLGNTNLTVNGEYNINIIGEGMNKTVFDGEARYTITGGTVWGEDDYWNPYTYQNANFFMTITEGEGHITLSDFNIEHMASIGGASIEAYEHATIDNYANLTVDNIYFYYNMAGVGSAIRNHRSGSVLMTNCLLSENRKSSSSGNDGILYNNGTMSIYNTIFDHNAGRWGVILNDYLLTIKDSTLKNGISYDLSSTYKYGSGIASHSGYADFFNKYPVTDFETIIENVTFINNGQSDIWQGPGDLKVNNCNFINSTGIIINDNQRTILNNYTIYQTINGSTFKNMKASTYFNTLSTNKGIYFGIYSLGNYQTIIENNTIELSENGYAIYATTNTTIRNNTLNNQIVIVGNNNSITNNIINSTKQAYAVEINNTSSQNNNISDNILYSAILTGNYAVHNNTRANTINNNNPESGEIININEDNFYEYFDENNKNIDGKIINGSIIYIENINDKNITFNNVKAYITLKNTNNILYNVSLNIINGSKLIIDNVKLNNTLKDENTIYIDSTGNLINSLTVYSKITGIITINDDENRLNNVNLYVYKNENYNDTSILNIISSKNELDNIWMDIYNNETVDEKHEITAINIEGDSNIISSSTISSYIADDIVVINICNSTNIQLDKIRINQYNNKTEHGKALNINNSSKINIISDIYLNTNNTAKAIEINQSNNTYYAGIDNNAINIISNNSIGVSIYNSCNTTLSAQDTMSLYKITGHNTNAIKINNSYNTIINLIKINDTRYNNNEAIIDISNSNNSLIEGIQIEETTINNKTVNDANTLIKITNSSNNTIQNYMRGDMIQPTNFKSNNTSILLNNSNNNYMMDFISYNENIPIILLNSHDNLINNTNLTSNINNTILINNSNNNIITNNILMSNNYSITGNTVENNGNNNIIKDNLPEGRFNITQDNYNEYFTDNTFNYKYSEIFISSDLYDKSLIFPELITIYNPNNYTLYNTTLTINKNNSIINDLNFNSTNDNENIITVNGNECIFNNINLYHETNGIAHTIITNAETNTTFNNLNINTIGAELKTTNELASIISIYAENKLILNKSNINTSINNYDREGTTTSIKCKVLDAKYLNISTIGNNIVIGIDSNYDYIPRNNVGDNRGRLSESNIYLEGNNTTIGTIGRFYDNIPSDRDNNHTFEIGTITVKSNDTAIATINNADLHYKTYVYADKLAVGILLYNDSLYNNGNYNTSMNIISNNTAYGAYIYNTGMKDTTPQMGPNFIDSCINITAKNITGIYAKDNHYNCLSIVSNMTLTGDNVTGIYCDYIDPQPFSITFMLSQQFSISSSNIIIDAKDNAIPVYIDNVITNSITNSHIIVKNYYLTDPIIGINNAINATIRNNYLLSNGVFGESAISVNASNRKTIRNNTPLSSDSLETRIILEGFDKLYRDANNLTITVTDYYDIAMNGTISIQFSSSFGNEQQFENIALINGTAKIIFTPDQYQQERSPGSIFTSITFTSDNPNYLSQSIDLRTNRPFKHNLTLTTSDTNGITNKEVTLTTNVIDDFNRTVNEGKISYYDADDNLLGESNVIDGVSILKTTFNHTYESIIKAVYNGTYLYNTTASESSLTIVSPELILNPITATAGETINISASITAYNETVTSINKGKVTFKVNGKTLKDTNGKVIYAKVVNGVATIENYVVPDDWTKEGTTIQAVYSGSTDCEKLTSQKTEITITQSIPTLTTSDVTATAGSSITLTATITDNNKVINNGKIVFKINGKTVKDASGKVIYAKVVNNTVSVEYTLPADLKAKDYNITATFISSDYDKLEDTKTLTITA